MAKVFISWSGKASHAVATTLYNWLPVVLQSVKPFISSEDLRKGGRWVSQLSDELEKTSFGIVCLTPSNLTAPWILFEAGALSKFVGDSHVAPFLVGVKPSELPGPLTQFNATAHEKDDFKKLIKSINASSGVEAVDPDLLDRSVETCWPKIDEELRDATELQQNSQITEKNTGSGNINGLFENIDPILQELLVLARSQQKILSDPERFRTDEHVRGSTANSPWMYPDHPVWIDLFQAVDRIKEFLNDELPFTAPETVRLHMDEIVFIVDYLKRHHQNGDIFTRRHIFRSNARKKARINAGPAFIQLTTTEDDAIKQGDDNQGSSSE